MASKKLEKDEKKHSRYLFLIFFIILLGIAFLIVRPFISVLILTAIIAYVLHPVYGYFSRITGKEGLSALFVILLLILVFLIPFAFVAGKLTIESYEGYVKAKQFFIDTEYLKTGCAAGDGLICNAYFSLSSFADRHDLDIGAQFATALSGFAKLLVSKASAFLVNIPALFVQLLISLFSMYYMLTRGKEMVAYLKDSLPLKREHKDMISSQFADLIYATIYGAVIMAIFQGIVAGLGYWMFGISSPLILGVLTMIAAFIPFVGAALVWVPITLSVLINGILVGDTSMLLKSALLAVYCAILVSGIDGFIKAKIVGDRAKVHPLVILLGVFGGIAFFGFVGIIVGPLLLTLFIAALKIYETEKEYLF